MKAAADQAGSPRAAQMQAIVAMSASMLAEARRGEWQSVVRLEQERRAALDGFFTVPVPMAEAGFIAAALQQILALDMELVALGENARRGALAELSHFATARQAQQAYAGAGV